MGLSDNDTVIGHLSCVTMVTSFCVHRSSCRFDSACYGYLSFLLIRILLFYAVLIRKFNFTFIVFMFIEPLVLNILHKEKVFDKQM